MTDSAQVRVLEEHDFEGWRSMWQGYQQFYGVRFDDAAVATTWSRLRHRDEPMHGAVASMQGRVVGLVHYLFHRSTWTSGDYCYLQDLYVAPAARQLGCARQLIGHVYEEARKKGASRVYWLTHESNTTAMRLYDQVAERPGFIQYRHVLPRTTG
ncbi:GNAT family N-acetyltransferase [Verminephrobacter eiseniae]|uniref:GNAT family N-acetyltransferase n=1 Tax=Verminephrobacter eiseniae TaxID=364317 RepID=UPI002236FE27|nr:GNAT family N-acetyltransferase [Verminephrobacter eiseniae]MCW5233137.1 GNAT family N-acetyltransferase [Verminephrobacter eiseniae]MCW5261298.1 GNAT family N-acetyltransferase [Verminephrobacter eiseniae]MCW5295308.1 GNAT family N-acetyltransferase [Verminephrobacter eiseniae]MCW8183580.1 GNAT family N-acetyltransferase [Verminephrobacter eiseniae]MCW8226280.1 GNAT family N-acetyltransferase [Verminephrobacter eiseniae]